MDTKQEITARFKTLVERQNTMLAFCKEFGVTADHAVALHYYKDPNAPLMLGRTDWIIETSASLEYELTKLLKERYEEDTTRIHLKPFALKLLEHDIDL